MENSSQSTSLPPSTAQVQVHNFMPMPAASSGAHEKINPKKEKFKSDLKEQMEEFWRKQREDSDVPIKDGRIIHPLPLARIRKVMKSNEEVKLVSSEAPMVLGRACELLIMELTERAWMHTKERNRKIIRRIDVAKALRDEDLFSFLHDTIPIPQEEMSPPPPPSQPPPPPQPLPPSAATENGPQMYASVPMYPFSFPMNMSSNFNPFEGSSSSAAHDPVDIDPRIAYEMNLQNMGHNFEKIDEELNQAPFAPQQPWADDQNLDYEKFMEIEEEMNQGPFAPQQPRANPNPAATNFMDICGELNQDSFAQQQPVTPNPNLASEDMQIGIEMNQGPVPPQQSISNPNSAYMIGEGLHQNPFVLQQTGADLNPAHKQLGEAMHHDSSPPQQPRASNPTYKVEEQMDQDQLAQQPPRANMSPAFENTEIGEEMQQDTIAPDQRPRANMNTPYMGWWFQL